MTSGGDPDGTPKLSRRCVVLFDGEHYPPVVATAIDRLVAEGLDVVAGFFLGGTEKTSTVPDLGFPVSVGDPEVELAGLLAVHAPDVVFDLSDEPVVDHRRRFHLAGIALRHGASYQGGGFRFDPPPLWTASTKPALAVSATGKRAGKTALAIELARRLRNSGRRVCIVTMGRGGPPEPVVLRRGEFTPDPAGLLRLSQLGLHAASDYVEDALFAGVDTVGTFRCGAGPFGSTVVDNFAAGVKAAEDLDPEILLLEGSGAALPPARADFSILVVDADIDLEYLRGYSGRYRMAIADAVVIVRKAGMDQRAETVQALIRDLEPHVAVYSGSFEIEATTTPAGRVIVATTASATAATAISTQIVSLGATQVAVVTALADRPRLLAELEGAGPVDQVLVEVKAAAVDIVIPWARDNGVPVGLLHNRLVLDEGGMEALLAAAVALLPRPQPG